MVGNLFLLQLITGDPYYLATRLLQRGSQKLAQLEGVCALAHTCATLAAYHISRAGFWAQVTEIATTVTDAETRHALLAAGEVNKIRICAGTGYCTLFAFVEMRTLEGAQRAMCMNGLQLMGFAIRVQTARNAVQDVVKEDAQFDADGNLLQPCLFGASQAPLSQYLTSTN